MAGGDERSEPSRRWSASWSREAIPAEPLVEVLVPTAGREAELAVTLAGLAAQDDPAFGVILSDQSDDAGPWRLRQWWR